MASTNSLKWPGERGSQREHVVPQSMALGVVIKHINTLCADNKRHSIPVDPDFGDTFDAKNLTKILECLLVALLISFGVTKSA